MRLRKFTFVSGTSLSRQKFFLCSAMAEWSGWFCDTTINTTSSKSVSVGGQKLIHCYILKPAAIKSWGGGGGGVDPTSLDLTSYDAGKKEC